MKPIEFKKQNTILQSAGTNDLPCFQGIDEDGVPVTVSFWEATPKELEQIFDNGFQ